MSDDESKAQETIRGVVERLLLLADRLPTGMDTRVEFGICDGKNLQLIDNVEVDHFVIAKADGQAVDVFVAFKAHQHPGEPPGKLLPGVTADVDDELRKLAGEESG